MRAGERFVACAGPSGGDSLRACRDAAARPRQQHRRHQIRQRAQGRRPCCAPVLVSTAPYPAYTATVARSLPRPATEVRVARRCRRCAAGAGRRPARSPAGSRRRRGRRGPARAGSRPRRPRPGRARRRRARPPSPAVPRRSRRPGQQAPGGGSRPDQQEQIGHGHLGHPGVPHQQRRVLVERPPHRRDRRDEQQRSAHDRSPTGLGEPGPQRRGPAVTPRSGPARCSGNRVAVDRGRADRPVRSPRPRPGSRPRRTRARRAPSRTTTAEHARPPAPGP